MMRMSRGETHHLNAIESESESERAQTEESK